MQNSVHVVVECPLIKSKPSVFSIGILLSKGKGYIYQKLFFFNPVANVCRILEEFRSEKKTTSTK